MNRKWKIILILSLLGNVAIFYVAIKALEYRAHINEYLDKYIYVVSEFSQRNRYADENKLYKTESQIPKRLVFFGTQLTENWPVENLFPNYETINRGVTGQRVSGFLLRFRPDVIELRPKAVIIEAASFDFRQQNSVKEIEDYFACLCELAQFHNIIPLPTTVIPPVRDIGIPDLGNYALLDSISLFNDWLKSYCRDHDVKCLDFNKQVALDDGYLSPDLSTGEIGLNEKGYSIISDMVIKSIETIK
jgi:lysophospholipase L1-like esterase